MYAYVLLCALFLELYVNKHSRLKVIIMITITICTTLSTTGLVLGLFAIAFRVLPRFFKQMNPILVITFILISIIILYIVKVLLSQKSESLSGMLRSNDFTAGVNAWKQNLVLGNGFGNYEKIVEQMFPWRQNNQSYVGYSSGLMNVLNDGGVMLMGVYVLPLLALGKCLFKKAIKRSALLAWMFIFIALSVSIVPYSPLTRFLLAYSYGLCFFDTELPTETHIE